MSPAARILERIKVTLGHDTASKIMKDDHYREMGIKMMGDGRSVAYTAARIVEEYRSKSDKGGK